MSEYRLFALFVLATLFVEFVVGVGFRLLGAGTEATASVLLLAVFSMACLGSYLYTRYLPPRDRRR